MNPYSSTSIKDILQDIRRHESRTFFTAFAAVMLTILSLLFIGMAFFPPWTPDLFIPVLPMQFAAVLLYRRSCHEAALARILDDNLTAMMRGQLGFGVDVKHRRGS